MRTAAWFAASLLAVVSVSTAVAAVKARPVLKRAGIRVALVFDVGGRGDHGFNDAANDGLMRATNELGASGEVVESLVGTLRGQALAEIVASRPDLVVAVGFLFSDVVMATARKHPDLRFALVDYVAVKGQAPPQNVLAVSFREDEGSFLAGALAAMTSKKGRVGFVGGMLSPIVKRFEGGFAAGARAVRPDVIVASAFVGRTPEAFANPGAAKTIALDLFDAGVDVAFHAAGASGLGVFDAARERQRLVIGVDVDQRREAPGLVPASMVKRIDLAVFEAIKAVHAGRFKGGMSEMTLANGGVDLLVDAKHPGITPAITAELARLRTEIIAGRLATSDDGQMGPVESR